ncbi:MAG: Hint domain-containing protein, partial [Paracoccaceae bacterium]
MAQDTPSWAWLGTGRWPGFSTNEWGRPNSQNYVNQAGNGLSVNPENYTDIIWRDGGKNPDGIINDNDSDDSSTAGNDRVVINGNAKTVHEVGAYSNSTLVINGQTHQMDVIVWLFTDGTYMVRIEDAEIPAYTHYSTVSQITLGTWDREEYTGSYIAPRTDPFLCFTPGTLIDTPDGPRLVEDLRPGDLVLTADHGAQPL